jgi:hypothetical protein
MSEKKEETPKSKDKGKHDDTPKSQSTSTTKKDDKSKTTGKANDDDDIPKPQSTSMKKDEKKDENEKKEVEHTVQDIDKELDELRPKPHSPKTQHRIEEQERAKDEEIHEHKTNKGSSMHIEAKSSEEGETHHKDNELTPGEPDPTVNENTKIPVLNDRGDVELKPQQGSIFRKNKNNNSQNNPPPKEDDKKETKE